MNKAIPNILSCARIALSIALALASGNGTLFVILYLLCGLSDVLDGYLARRFHAQSALGARLDSLGDFVFWAVVLYLLLIRMNAQVPPLFLAGLGVVFVMRAVNFLLTRVKFRTWGMLHSLGNKATGLLLYFAVPVFVLAGRFFPPLVVLLFAIAAASALEETVILLVSPRYSVNCAHLGMAIKESKLPPTAL